VSRQFRRTASRAASGCLCLVVAACGGADRTLQQTREKIDSLRSTTETVAEAWLGGLTSRTYTRTALEQTFQLVDEQRTALAGSPSLLADPRGAQLSQDAERLSRGLAVLIHDVNALDQPSTRQHLAAIRTPASEPR
jgi:hypothetical protein